MKKLLKLGLVAAVMAITVGLDTQANAAEMTVDGVIYASSGTLDPYGLSGRVFMDWNSSLGRLSIGLVNTSDPDAYGAPNLAAGYLTGLGFNLPNGVTIGGGSAEAPLYSILGPPSSPTVLHNFPASYSPPVNLSGEWGYDNPPVSGGLFQSVAGVNAAVSSMTSQTEAVFAPGDPSLNIDGENDNGGLKGPDFGLITRGGASAGAGNEAIEDSITIDLYLSGIAQGFDLLGHIQAGQVWLSFGSPDTIRNGVPDGGTTLSLLGLALLGVGVLSRKLAK